MRGKRGEGDGGGRRDIYIYIYIYGEWRNTEHGDRSVIVLWVMGLHANGYGTAQTIMPHAAI